MSHSHSRPWAAWVLMLIALTLPLAALSYYMLQKHHWAQERMAEIEPRHARLLGLQAQRAEVEETFNQAKSVRAQYVYPASQDVNQTGNAVQQRVRDILTAAGLQVLSSQVLPAKVDGSLDRIPLTVRADGELSALHNALAVLATQTPFIAISELEVQVQGVISPNGPPRLSAQLSLSVLKDRP